MVAKMLALYAFDWSYTPPSQDKAGFTYPAGLRRDYTRVSWRAVVYVHHTRPQKVGHTDMHNGAC